MAKSNSILKTFFTSDTRIAVLSHFFMHPDASFYLRQLERLLGISSGQLIRELKNLEQAALLIPSREGNQKRYALNRDFPLYDELRSIILKTAGAGDMLRDSLSSTQGLELVFIYGSFAKGEEHASSDIDVMIVGSTSDSDANDAISKAEKKLNRTVNYSLYDREEVKQRLKDENGFIVAVFSEPHIILVGNKDDELFQTRE